MYAATPALKWVNIIMNTKPLMWTDFIFDEN